MCLFYSRYKDALHGLTGRVTQHRRRKQLRRQNSGLLALPSEHVADSFPIFCVLSLYINHALASYLSCFFFPCFLHQKASSSLASFIPSFLAGFGALPALLSYLLSIQLSHAIKRFHEFFSLLLRWLNLRSPLRSPRSISTTPFALRSTRDLSTPLFPPAHMR